MKHVRVSLVSGPLTDAIIDGTIEIAGDATYTVTRASSVDQNSREMLDGMHDVAEMSFATYIKARDLGHDLIGLPVFTGRGFLQPGLTVSLASGIKRPEQLAGKRVAVPQFWMTSTMWHRLILTQQHSVRDESISWYTTSPERFTDVPQSDGVAIYRLGTGVSIVDALARGLVDATMVPPRGVSTTPNPATHSLFSDLERAQSNYFATTGIFPIMHFVVVRASLAAELPWLAGALTAAFTEAKLQAVRTGSLPSSERWTFGLRDNAVTLECFLSFARDKTWVSPARTLDDYFVS